MGFTNTALHREAIDLSNKFKQLFNKYSACHNLMNSTTYFNLEKLQKLGKQVSFIYSCEFVKNLCSFVNMIIKETWIGPRNLIQKYK